MLGRQETWAWRKRERESGQRLIKALKQRYQKEFRHPRREIARLGRDFRFKLVSHNSRARRLWFRSLGGHLCALLGAGPPSFRLSQPVFMLTLIGERMVDPDKVTTAGERQKQLAKIRDNYAEHLKGLDCLGMIDAGLYVSLQRTHHAPRLINYHCHVLVWGIDAEQMEARCKRIRIGMTSPVPYVTPAYYRQVRRNDLLQVLWYCTKAPRQQYQLHRRASNRLHQYARSINGVNAVRLYAAMRDFTLPELTLAFGQGRSIVEHARGEIRRREGAAL